MTKGMTSFVSLPQDHDLVDLVGRIFPEILSFKTRYQKKPPRKKRGKKRKRLEREREREKEKTRYARA